MVNINELQAGPALDDLVAERVCGFVIDRFTFEYDGMFKKCRVWVDNEGKKHNPKPYSTDIAAAWEVAEKMTEADFCIWKHTDIYTCEVFKPSREWKSVAKTAPLAICRAALLAVGGGK